MTNNQIDKITGEVITAEIEGLDTTALSLLISDADLVKKAIASRNTIAKVIKENLKKDTDYGSIAKNMAPSLWQAGATKLALAFGVSFKYEIVEKTLDTDAQFLDYTYKAIAIVNDKVIGEATANANSYEQKFRNVFQNYDAKTGEWSQNKGKSVYDIKNNIVQMAQKRAMVRVIRNILGINSVFTQDLEDIPNSASPRDVYNANNVYSALYQYISYAQGADDKSKQQWLRQNVLTPMLKENGINNFYKYWSPETCKKIIDLVNAWGQELDKKSSAESEAKFTAKEGGNFDESKAPWDINFDL